MECCAGLSYGKFPNPVSPYSDLAQLIHTTLWPIEIHQVYEYMLDVIFEAVQGELQAARDPFPKIIREFDIACADNKFHCLSFALNLSSCTLEVSSSGRAVAPAVARISRCTHDAVCEQSFGDQLLASDYPEITAQCRVSDRLTRS
jgi:hypothetical protein